jgi:hypothetical protein
VRRQTENRAHIERAQNLAAQIDEPRDARWGTRHAPQVADARDLTQLLERKPVDLRAEIEAEIRAALLFLAWLRIAVALLLDCCKDVFRIHWGPRA